MRKDYPATHPFPSITEHFYHTELIGRHDNWDAFAVTFNPILNGQLKFEFAVQSHDIVFHIAEQEHQSTESGYHGLQISSTVRM